MSGDPSGSLALQAAAAMLVSDDIAEVERAHRALLGLMAKEPQARALAATAYDRLRMLRGEPQKFGTQWVAGARGNELWPVDPATTDSERTKWNLPPLAELRRRAGG